MGLCAQPGNYTIVTELMPRGSVFDILRDKSIELSFKRKMKMVILFFIFFQLIIILKFWK